MRGNGVPTKISLTQYCIDQSNINNTLAGFLHILFENCTCMTTYVLKRQDTTVTQKWKKLVLRVVDEWNRLSNQVVSAEIDESFKDNTDNHF